MKTQYKILTILLAIMLATNTEALSQALSTFPYECGFNSAASINTEWTQSPNNATPWIIGTGSSARSEANNNITGPLSAKEGGAFAYVNLVESHTRSEVTISKAFDFSDVEVPVITLWAYTYWSLEEADGGYISVKYTLENGTTYEVIKTSSDMPRKDQWEYLSGCMNRAAGHSNVKVSITVKGATNGYLPNMAIDNLKIENLSVKAKIKNPECYADNNGEITITPQGGAGKYKYSVNFGTDWTDEISGSSYKFTSLKAGEYPIKIMDVASGCEASLTDIQLTNPAEIVVTTKVEDIKCFGDNDGKIIIYAKETDKGRDVSHTPYSFSIDGLTWHDTQAFENMAGGDYTVRVKNAVGCFSKPVDVTVGNDVLLEFRTVSKTDITDCYGDTKGTISMTVNHGKNDPIDFSIDHGKTYNNYSPIFSGLAAGTYELTIKDKYGCTIDLDTNVVINQPDEFVLSEVTHTDVTGCNGDKTGTIDIEVSGGTEPYFYSIDEIVYQESNGHFENLAAKTYYPMIKDSKDCIVTIPEVVVGQPSTVTIQKVKVDNVETCHGDLTGKITITAQGGTGDLKYYNYHVPQNAADYSLDGNTPQSENVFTGLGTGRYLPYVSDQENCLAYWNEVEIDEPEEFKFFSAEGNSGRILCNGDKKGYIRTMCQGGQLPYRYTINDWATDSKTDVIAPCEFNELGAGIYTIKAKDKMGCSAGERQIEITEPEKVTMQVEEVIDVECFGLKTGEVIISADGGTHNYSYGVRRLAIAKIEYKESGHFKDLIADKYYFVVQDNNGCTAMSDQVEVKEPEKLTFANGGIAVYDVSTCYGDNTGSIHLSAIGGTPPYQYTIDDGVTYQEGNSFENLPEGKYYLGAKDANGCEVFDQGYTSLAAPNPVVYSNVYYTDVKGCKGEAKGLISFKGQGGYGAMNYHLLSEDGQLESEDGEFPNLKAGKYKLLLDDSRGCHPVSQMELEITEPEEFKLVDIDVTDLSCYDYMDGKTKITATGGMVYSARDPYYFYLNDNEDYTMKGEFTSLQAGHYTFRVKDTYGCTLNGEFDVAQPDQFKIENITRGDVEGCHGDNSGSLEITTSGGIGDVTYYITGSYFSGHNQTGLFENLRAGQYAIIARDNHECETDEEVETITQPTAIHMKASRTKDIKCYGEGYGEIEVDADGGSGSYQVSLDNGKTWDYGIGTISPLESGTYIVKVRDINNCESTNNQDIYISAPKELIAGYEKEDLACFNGNTGKIQAWAEGGTMPYFYSIDKEKWQTPSGLFKELTDGTYKVYIHDFNNCETETEEITLIRPENRAGFQLDVVEGCTPLKVVITQDFKGLTNYAITNKSTNETDLVWDKTGPTEYIFQNTGKEPQKFNIHASILLKDGIGCTDEADDEVLVYPKPEVNFDIINNNIEWPNNRAYLANTSRKLLTANWDLGDGNTSTDMDLSEHEYDNCGQYNIILVGYDGHCTNRMEKTFTIKGRDIMPMFKAKTRVDGKEQDPIGCEPVEVHFDNNSMNTDSCRLDFGDGSDPIYNVFSNIKHTYKAPGIYKAKLTLYGDCQSETSITKEIIVHGNPSAEFIQNLDTVYQGQSLKLECLTHNAEQYEWDFGDGKKSREKKPEHKYEFSGNFNISLKVSTVDNCSDTAVVRNAVVVISNPIVVFPNCFTPDGDGRNDRFYPVHGDIAEYEIIIMNRLSNVMYRSKDINEGWDGTKDGIPCPPGMYVYKVKYVLRDKSFKIVYGNVFLLR
ncbi:MAG: PKD domain-containing protein [Bacteroidales bacterium]|nr:PKD domain-containing protein [Bacteroidales bacterium]